MKSISFFIRLLISCNDETWTNLMLYLRPTHCCEHLLTGCPVSAWQRQWHTSDKGMTPVQDDIPAWDDMPTWDNTPAGELMHQEGWLHQQGTTYQQGRQQWQWRGDSSGVGNWRTGRDDTPVGEATMTPVEDNDDTPATRGWHQHETNLWWLASCIKRMGRSSYMPIKCTMVTKIMYLPSIQVD